MAQMANRAVMAQTRILKFDFYVLSPSRRGEERGGEEPCGEERGGGKLVQGVPPDSSFRDTLIS